MNISLVVSFEFYFRDGSLDLAFLLSAAGFSGFYPGEEEGKKISIKPAHQKEYYLNAQIQKIRSICQQYQRKSILLEIIFSQRSSPKDPINFFIRREILMPMEFQMTVRFLESVYLTFAKRKC